MSKQVLEKQKVVAQIEEAANKYANLKKKTDHEITEIIKKLLEIGIPGNTVVKLKPVWQHDVDYLLREHSKNLNDSVSKKMG